jgi:hypothetical protein
MEIKTNINSYNVPILNARIHGAVAVEKPPLWEALWRLSGL